MLKYLLQHAIKSIWCSPFQDDQAIMRLSRISPIERYRDYFKDHWTRIDLPTKKEDYHVYIIGQNNQTRLNLTEKRETWVKATEIARTYYNSIELYTATGLQLNRDRCWFYLDETNCYYVAIQMQPSVLNLDNNPVYLRVYKNAFFGSDRDDTGTSKIVVDGKQLKTVEEALPYQKAYLQYKARSNGHAYAFHNGALVDNFMPDDLKVGDNVEYFYDGSATEIIDFKISNLQVFTSEVDKCIKYLLHPPKKINTIAYRDDVDFWVIKKFPNGRFRGRYYNRNQENSIRMVTHRDWSIPTAAVNDLILSESSWQNTEGLYIRAVIRNAGYDRPLVDEHHRIKELYKLKDAEIIRAMVGLDSTVEEWTAAKLEASSYPRIMRSYFHELSGVETLYACGYNGVSKLIGDSPVNIVNGAFKVPFGCQGTSTVYEYDANGLLVNWRAHPGGDLYYPTTPVVKLVEFVDGEGGKLADFQLSTSQCRVERLNSYRFYVSSMNVAGVPFNDWKDVTGDSDYYTIGSTGTVIWKIDSSGQLGVVKGNSKFISYDLELADYNHVYRFHLNHSTQQAQVLHIPPGRIDVWMNGRALIENTDYFVEWPELVVCNKEYLAQGAGKQKFTIRGYHFCESDMSRSLAPQRDFVKHGMLSVNNVYDLRDDKVVQVICDGRTFHRDAIKFSESRKLVTINGITEGRPYLIQDAITPIRGVIDYDTYPLRDSSLDLDGRVSDYLSTKLPESLPPHTPSIKERYIIYSPTMGRLVHDLGKGLILPLAMTAPESEVAKFMIPYVHLLVSDPCRKDLDFRYLHIHPHPQNVVLDVTSKVYSFLERINRLYLNSRVDLTPFLSIDGLGLDVPEVPKPPELPDPEPEPLPPPRTIIASDQGNITDVALAPVTVTEVVVDDAVYGAFVSTIEYPLPPPPPSDDTVAAMVSTIYPPNMKAEVGVEIIAVTGSRYIKSAGPQ